MFNKKKKAKAAKIAAGKKVEVKKVVRPEAPKAPAPVPPKPVVKKPIAKPADIVKVHVLGNAMIDGKQYPAGWEGSVSATIYRALGTSCVSMAKWRIIQEKGGLNSLHK